MMPHESCAIKVITEILKLCKDKWHLSRYKLATHGYSQKFYIQEFLEDLKKRLGKKKKKYCSLPLPYFNSESKIIDAGFKNLYHKKGEK